MAGLTLMAVTAHPDDETAVGGTLAKYADQGVHTILVAATRGEAGQISDPSLATPETLGEVRERELRCACEVLGVKELFFLDYLDGTLEEIDAEEAVGKLVYLIRLKRPQVLVTFGPDGAYGHPDHIAVHRWTTQAFSDAANPQRYPEHFAAGLEPYAPAKLYYRALPRSLLEAIPALAQVRIPIKGAILKFQGVPDSQITTCIDVSAYVERKYRALTCHKTQFDPAGPFAHISKEEFRELNRCEYFVLARSRLSAPEGIEEDLFAGLKYDFSRHE